jgi:hypothetical protein
MKKTLLLSLAFMIGLAVVAQTPQIKNGVFVRNYQKDQKVSIEPVEKTSVSSVTSKPSGLKNGDNTNIVSVLDLGTSANVLGYSSGTRPMVWADDDLNVVINFHRFGPGSTPGLSGFLGMDLGINNGMDQADWTPQIQAANSNLVSSPYWYDAGRYPCAGIYNPEGNTTMANAYLTYFAPNFCNTVLSGFGGYTYGTMNLVNYADSNRNLRWFDANPVTYIPDGFTITSNGVSHMVDSGQDPINGAAYVGYIVYGRGIWNAATHDFDYTFTTFPLPTVDNQNLADVKVAASPDGNTVWISALGQLVGSTPLVDSSYAPILMRSTDGGLTWGTPKVIQLDGPNGISAVKNQWSDYFIENFFVGPPWPSRDEIPYTTAFDHSLSVDIWGNPHIGVGIGYAPGGGSISTGVDSLINVYDIYSVNDGLDFQGVYLGPLKTFRGTWATYTSDNRVYTSRNKTGDKMFFTWNDTRIEGEANNQNPDVYARGFDLRKNMLTADNGADACNNVTFLCDITQEAYWQCTSPIIFTDNNKYTLPICTQWFQDAALDSKFKYIPDFSYVDGDFTIPVEENPFPVGIDQKKDVATVSVYPNPVKDFAKVSVNLTQGANVTVSVTNLVGQNVLSLNKGNMSAGLQQFNVDANSLSTGVYFITVNVNGQKFTQKMIVE